ncbi:uroporphyrinogen decarboxylase family protein [Slackia heliotrinireducens]|uniref:uroporphyrinogen decarboxylase family protein n=1 Tax=Slackia heliotrinireducens TaxID=84110 RepID=UPI0033157CD8
MLELIQMEMTPKERLAAYARGEEVDRIPTTLSAGETGCLHLLGIPICDYYFSADIMVRIESFLADSTGADNLGMGLGLRTVPEALGCKLAYPETSVSYVEEPALKSLDEVEGRPHVDVRKDGRLPIMIEAFQRLQDKYGDVRTMGSGLAGPFTTAATLYGVERFLKATRKNPEGVHRLMQYATDCVVECCRDLHEILGIGFSLSEPVASKDLVSKRQFNEFFVPYLRQCVERMSEFQNVPSLHICGHTNDRWSEVVECGISGFWVDNCESLCDLKNAHGSNIGISGNVAPVDVLRNGTQEAIAASVRDCIEQAADNPRGFTLCPGCTTPVGTSLDNMIAFMNAAATYGRGARKGCMPQGLQSA